MKVIDGGITAAKGYEAAGVMAGIKYKNRKDMALIYSQTPCEVAGTFTSNLVKAAPVLWDQKVVSDSKFGQAIVINSGVANACTGKEGMQYCEQEAEAVAKSLGIPKEAVMVASTGVIGMQLPMERIASGIELLSCQKDASRESAKLAAEAIMTTDTKSKEVAVTFMVGEVEVTLGGMCKGSGMIHPNMCTMLGFLTTDLRITKELLQEALSEDVKDTFNMISVDGDTSTNDTLLIMANGLAGNTLLTSKEDIGYQEFCDALRYVNQEMSMMLAGDGEGATALFETKVVHAESKEQARILAKAVICSSLTKAAIFGHDANWGRILCAMGYSGATFDPDHMQIYFESSAGRIMIYENGVATNYSEKEATEILSKEKVTVLVDLLDGQAQATAWGCDLTYDYVKINADYRS